MLPCTDAFLSIFNGLPKVVARLLIEALKGLALFQGFAGLRVNTSALMLIG